MSSLALAGAGAEDGNDYDGLGMMDDSNNINSSIQDDEEEEFIAASAAADDEDDDEGVHRDEEGRAGPYPAVLNNDNLAGTTTTGAAGGTGAGAAAEIGATTATTTGFTAEESNNNNNNNAEHSGGGNNNDDRRGDEEEEGNAAGGDATAGGSGDANDDDDDEYDNSNSSSRNNNNNNNNASTSSAAAATIWEPAEYDVISGRGAAVNAHTGNKKFRALCYSRKPEFEAGNHAAKRRIASEIVAAAISNWGTRFIRKKTAVDGKNSKDGKGGGSSKGAYFEMTFDQAILKASQVMRDHRRPDRIEQRSEPNDVSGTQSWGAGGGDGNSDMKKRKRRNRATATPMDGIPEPPAVPLPPIVENPFGVNEHDVLCGRGAYVNSHVGNQLFRDLAVQRKAQFESGSFTEKRTLATEIVMHIRNLDPPGRFLRKVPVGAGAKSESGSEQDRQQQHGGSSSACAPAFEWEELSDERAIHKACQVIRDLHRPDRKDREERKKTRLLKKEKQKFQKQPSTSSDLRPTSLMPIAPALTPPVQEQQQQQRIGNKSSGDTSSFGEQQQQQADSTQHHHYPETQNEAVVADTNSAFHENHQHNLHRGQQQQHHYQFQHNYSQQQQQQQQQYQHHYHQNGENQQHGGGDHSINGILGGVEPTPVVGLAGEVEEAGGRGSSLPSSQPLQHQHVGAAEEAMAAAAEAMDKALIAAGHQTGRATSNMIQETVAVHYHKAHQQPGGDGRGDVTSV